MSRRARPDGAIPTPRQLAAQLNAAEGRPPTPRSVPVIAPEPPPAAAPAWRPIRSRLADGATVPLLLFAIGPERFGAPLDEVLEAIDAPDVHQVAPMGDASRGVIALRGALVPVVDPAPPLGLPASTAGVVLVVARGDRRLALAVDDVLDVHALDPASVRTAPGTAAADGILVGAARTPMGWIGVLDLPALVTACLPSSPEPA